MPIRSCVACRQRFDQRDLIRVARTPIQDESGGDGLTLIAVPGRQLEQPSGRSAYFCSGCRDRVKPASLARTLRCPVTPASLDALPQYLLNGHQN